MCKCKYCEEVEMVRSDGEELYADFPVGIDGIQMYYRRRSGQYKLYAMVDGADIMTSDADFCVVCERGF